jgi:hypothetical protein
MQPIGGLVNRRYISFQLIKQALDALLVFPRSSLSLAGRNAATWAIPTTRSNSGTVTQGEHICLHARIM